VTSSPLGGRAQAPAGPLTAIGTGSSALAPAAHGGLPPERYPGHRPSPVGRRHAPPSTHPCGNGHPPGAPVLSRGRPPSRALRPAASASHAMALRATLDCDLARINPAPVRRMARSEPARACIQQEGPATHAAPQSTVKILAASWAQDPLNQQAMRSRVAASSRGLSTCGKGDGDGPCHPSAGPRRRMLRASSEGGADNEPRYG
jgi:hypothetical protein